MKKVTIEVVVDGEVYNKGFEIKSEDLTKESLKKIGDKFLESLNKLHFN